VPISNKQKETGLSDKMERFCEEYVVDFNGTQAAIRAGYSKKTAREISKENLIKPPIQAKIRELQAKKSEDTIFTAKETLEKLWDMIGFDITSILTIGEGGEVQYKPMSEWPENATKYISEIEEKSTIKESADGASQAKFSNIKVKIPNKEKLIELAMRHLGLLNDKLLVGNKDVLPFRVTYEQKPSKE
jgi:phage terminase small subunit